MLLLLTLLAADTNPCEGLAPGHCVSGGVLQVGELETVVPTFTARVVPAPPEGWPPDCVQPSPAEWIRAGERGMTPPPQPVYLASPASESCDWGVDEVEAEGVTGNVWVGGAPWPPEQDMGTSEVHRDHPQFEVRSVNANAWHFWGVQPEPMGHVCVDRATIDNSLAYVHASRLNLRARRDPASPALASLKIGTPVEIRGTSGEWVYVVAAGVNGGGWLADNELVEWGMGLCLGAGWVKAAFLESEVPTRELYLARAKGAATPQNKVSALERAGALAPNDVQLQLQLIKAYSAAGMATDAAALKAKMSR